MQRACDSCGERYEAKRPSSRFCTPRCRKRHQRNPGPDSGPVAVPAVPFGDSALVTATKAELLAAGKLDTVLGQQAVRLAERMCGLMDTGSAIASLSRELRAVMAEALADAPKAGDAMDELARRRRDRAAGA